MILIFGGAYQGKLDFAKKEFNIESTCDCSKGAKPDFKADAIFGIEGFVLECVKQGVEAKDYFIEHENELLCADEGNSKEKVLIMTDTSQGVVPIDKDVRAAREMNGRLMLYLANKADRVIRVFCGIGKDIK